MMKTDFSVGQVWKYKTRSHEDESEAPGGKTTFIGHLPYSEQALGESVTELVGTADSLPDFEDGYKLWKSAFDDGEAGVFEVAVSEAIEGVQQSVA